MNHSRAACDVGLRILCVKHLSSWEDVILIMIKTNMGITQVVGLNNCVNKGNGDSCLIYEMKLGE